MNLHISRVNDQIPRRDHANHVPFRRACSIHAPNLIAQFYVEIILLLTPQIQYQ